MGRAFPFPATIDSLSCAISVAELRPGFLDGKPAYAFLGQAVAGVNTLMGGGRADLMRRLAIWCALFAWGMAVVAYLIARELYGGSAARGWAAAGLMASSPIFLFMAAIVEKYTVNLFLILLAALLWLRRRYVSWGIAWGLAVGAHVTSILLAIPCAVSLLIDPGRRSDLRPALKGGFLAAAVAAPLYLWVLSYAQGIGVYLGYLRDMVFGEYAFMKPLRPDRLAAAAAGSPARTALLLLVALGAGAALLSLVRHRSRISRAIGRAAAAAGSRSQETEIAVWAAVGIAAVGIAWAYLKNLAPFLRLAGIPLLGLGALRLIELAAARLRPAEAASTLPSAAGREEAPAIGTFVLPWLATNLLFFMAWDHFYGQFSIYLVPPLALLAAGLGAAGIGGGSSPAAGGVAIAAAAEPRGGARTAGSPGLGTSLWERAAGVAILATVLAGLWLSRDVVERTRWRVTLENDEFAREAVAAIPPGSLVVAAWDAFNLAFHGPSLEVLSVVAGEGSRVIVWKGKRRHTDVAGDVRQALRSGRRAYVTRRWLEQPDDAFLSGAREALKSEFDLRPAGRWLFEVTPRRSSQEPIRRDSATMEAHDG